MECPGVGQGEARVAWLGDLPVDENDEEDEEEKRLERQSENSATINVEPPLTGDGIKKEATCFNDLEQLQDRPDLLRGIYAEGLEALSSLQRTLLPILLGTSNVVVHCAIPGTGKSAALAVAMLAHVDAANPATQCVCVCPVREIAIPLCGLMRALGKFTTTTFLLALAGMAKPDGGTPHHIVIGTPRRIADMARKRLLDLRQVRIFATDEAHRLLEEPRNDLRLVQRMLPRDCRVVWVAGTKVQVELVPQPRTVVSMQRNRLALTGRQFYIPVNDTEEARLSALAALYASVVVPRSLIFCSSDDVADRLVLALSAAGHTVGHLRSDAASEQCHATTLDEFTSGKTRVLIATQLMEGGLADGMLVVNFDVPQAELRSGRAYASAQNYLRRPGFFGHPGLALHFVPAHSTSEELWRRSGFELPLQELSPDALPHLAHRLLNGLL